MSGSETVSPDRLRQLASDLQAEVGPSLDQAKAYFDAAKVPGTAFSNAGLPMQIVYPGTREWAIRDTQTKHDELMSIHDRLIVTADLWSGAEQNNCAPMTTIYL